MAGVKGFLCRAEAGVGLDPVQRRRRDRRTNTPSGGGAVVVVGALLRELGGSSYFQTRARPDALSPRTLSFALSDPTPDAELAHAGAASRLC